MNMMGYLSLVFMKMKAIYIYIDMEWMKDNSKQGYTSCASSVLTFFDIMEKG